VKAVLQYRASPGFRRRLEQAAPEWLEVVVVDESDLEHFEREMRDASALLHVLEPVTASVIAEAPALGLIQKIGVGVNTIDLDAARAHDVAVCNMPGTNSRAVAELTLALMLAAIRRVPYFDRETRAGRGAWSATAPSLAHSRPCSSRSAPSSATGRAHPSRTHSGASARSPDCSPVRTSSRCTFRSLRRRSS
jgi:phosphoglycerate dehydrogenase-like enzyme